jgi:Zn-dependent peptidase ImmA (M78 family)
MITNAIHVDKSFPALMRNSQSAAGTEQIEIAANQFAAELLMPKAIIVEMLAGKQFDIDDDAPIEELAKRFRVSRQALAFRLRQAVWWHV